MNSVHAVELTYPDKRPEQPIPVINATSSGSNPTFAAAFESLLVQRNLRNLDTSLV